MAKSYADITAQIEKLQREAEALRAKEAAEVVARIKEAIDHYGLTPADLGFGKRGGKVAVAKKGRGRPAVKETGAARKRAGATVKFRDEAGNTWSGRGKRPNWFKTALEAGKTPEELLAS